MTTIKRLFVAGAFWLAVKVLRISPAALIAAATSWPAPPEAHQPDKETNRYTEHSGEPWPRGHVHRMRRRGLVPQKTSPGGRGERR